MARRWVLTGIVAVVLVVATVFAARAIRDDDTKDTAASSRRTTTSSGSTTTTSVTSTTSTTAAPTTTTPASTTTIAPPNGTPPGPCGADAGPIRAAIDAGVANAQANADVASCRLAASDPTWAAVQLSARPGAQFDPVTVIVHGGAGAWSIVATGGPGAGCGAAPQQVIADLGQFCVGTGGGGT
jgi:hypothetical protein